MEKGCLHLWDPSTRKGLQTPQGLLPWSCEVRLDTFSDTPALCSGTNIGYGVGENRHRQRPYSCINPPPSNLAQSLMHTWGNTTGAALPGFSTPSLSKGSATHDGRDVYTLRAPVAAVTTAAGDIAAALQVAELPLATTPSAAGKSVHFTVLARVITPAFTPSVDHGYNGTLPTLTLLIDRGDGAWLASNGGRLCDWGGDTTGGLGAPPWMNGDWDVHSFSARLGWVGTARMALAVASGGVVDVSMLKVAQIGM